MNVLILNASPKSKGSTSAFYSSLLRLFLTGCEVKVNPLRGARDCEKAVELLPWADAVVLSAPVYVDAAPSHVTAFLEQAEQLCQEQLCHFKLYAISNCGFIEGHQNELHLRIYEAWCQCAGVCWGGGLGIGGGVILRWMCMLTALFAVLDTVRLILTAQAASLTVQTIFSCYSSMLVMLVMSLGAVICLAVMGPPYQARCLPQESLHSLPDAVIFVHPRFRHFYAALRVSTWKLAAHTIPQAQMPCPGGKNTPIKLLAVCC